MSVRSVEPSHGGAVTVGSLKRGLEILDMFTAERAEIGIGEMATHLDIHKSSASRLASTLAQCGYLRTAGGQGVYHLGARLSALGAIATRERDVVESILPQLQLLTNETGETGHLALLEGSMATTIAITDGWHTVRMHSYVGKTNYAHCSSMGKALLAGLNESSLHSLYPSENIETRTGNTIATKRELLQHLAEIRETGFALDDEELEIGLRCIAAPVFAPDGSVPVSISISGPSQRIARERVQAVSEHVRWCAWKASMALGTTRVPEGYPSPPISKPDPLPWIDPEQIPTLNSGR